MATIYEARCSRGDFQQEVIAFPVCGYRLEEAPDVHMWVQSAWCRYCQKVVHAEHLSSPGEAEKMIEGSTDRRTRRDAERYCKMLASRQAPPRCLLCGETDIIPASGKGSERIIPHPACGGSITFHHAGRARISSETHLYSSEGEHITIVTGILMPGRGYGRK